MGPKTTITFTFPEPKGKGNKDRETRKKLSEKANTYIGRWFTDGNSFGKITDFEIKDGTIYFDFEQVETSLHSDFWFSIHVECYAHWLVRSINEVDAHFKEVRNGERIAEEINYMLIRHADEYRSIIDKIK